jgi:hypothetical protein
MLWTSILVGVHPEGVVEMARSVRVDLLWLRQPTSGMPASARRASPLALLWPPQHAQHIGRRAKVTEGVFHPTPTLTNLEISHQSGSDGV